MEKPVYRMSEAGYCPRALSARRLGYDPLPRTQEEEDRLWYYSMLESVAAHQMMAEWIRLEHGGVCEICQERYGEERSGIHVEIDTPLLLLVGHLDRRAIINGDLYPVEIKGLGRFSHREFEQGGFPAFPDYAGQEACYLEAEGKPGLYWVLNRDTGVPIRLTVNDSNGVLALPRFTPATLPRTFAEILDELNNVELHVQEGMLVEVEEPCSDRRRRYCRFRYLCENVKGVEVTTREVLDAAHLYVTGDDEEKAGKDKKQEAVKVLIGHAKATENTRPMRIGGLVSFSYHGEKRKRWLDEQTVRRMAPPDVVAAAEKEGNPFDSYTIKRLKDE